MQHRQLAAINKHKPQELLSHRNCCTASSSSPTAVGPRCCTPQTPDGSTGSSQWTPSPPQDPSGASPTLPSSLLPALFAHEFPSTRCDRRQRGAAQIPPWCLRSRGCRGVEGQSRELLLMENTSHGEDFQHRAQERERGKEIGCAGGGEAREGQEGRGDTAMS